ncbi:hypothetical protein INT45_012937 [Circinella minor]|uniref:ATP-dependent DNA helicase n=2 Tax=Circinella minor TaxID=1195481 RepID=A0A8H7S3Q3_9FUNG|nr:hypothetical protein INT45_012937 [Circinella minor]
MFLSAIEVEWGTKFSSIDRKQLLKIVTDAGNELREAVIHDSLIRNQDKDNVELNACGSTTHLNRNNRDCPLNRRNNNNERNVRPRIDTSNNDPISCPNCGSTTHSDPSHAECTSANINSNNNNDNLMQDADGFAQEQLENLEEEDNGAVLDRITEELNSANQGRRNNVPPAASTPVLPPPFPTRRCPKFSEHGAQFRIACQEHFEPENIFGYNICYTQESRFYRRHIFPRMNTPCPSCGAQMWIDERLTASSLTNPRFGLCCLSCSIKIGGRTAHSRFKIPLNADDSTTCTLPLTGPHAHIIREAKLIIWNEAVMCGKYNFQAVDRALRDVMGAVDERLQDVPFGSKVVVFGGDFRQILPVIKKGTRSEVVGQSIRQATFWD